jgi:hypothetical protein
MSSAVRVGQFPGGGGGCGGRSPVPVASRRRDSGARPSAPSACARNPRHVRGRVPKAAASQAAIISASSSAKRARRCTICMSSVSRLSLAGGGDVALPTEERRVMTVSSGNEERLPLCRDQGRRCCRFRRLRVPPDRPRNRRRFRHRLQSLRRHPRRLDRLRRSPG